MSYLEALARGLRGAGGVLSPGAFQAGQESDMLAQRGAQAAALQERNLAAQKAIRAEDAALRFEDRAMDRVWRSAEAELAREAKNEENRIRARERLDEIDARNAGLLKVAEVNGASKEAIAKMVEEGKAERRAMEERLRTMGIELRKDRAKLPKAPVGYRWNENGDELEPIPGGPKDKGAQKGRQLGAKDVTKLALEENEAERTQSLYSTFKDEYSGPTAAAKNFAGQYVPGVETDVTNWWKDYRKQEIVMRNRIFGSALTDSEKKSWADANVSPSMRPDVVRKNLEARAKLEKKAFRAQIDRLGQSGYDVTAFGGGDSDNDPLGLR